MPYVQNSFVPVGQNTVFDEQSFPGSVQPTYNAYVNAPPPAVLNDFDRQKIQQNTEEIKDILKYPFPFRFKVYNQAHQIYHSVLKLVRVIPKDLRSILGESMSSYFSNLLRETHRINNEDDPKKRIKGWKTCVDLLQAGVADIVVCLKEYYGEQKRIYSLLNKTYRLTLSYLHLISTEKCKIAMKEQTLSREQKDQMAQMIAEMDYAIEKGVINQYIPTYVNNAPAMNIGPKQLKDPDPRNNTSNNYVNVIAQSYGLPVNLLVENNSVTNKDLVQTMTNKQPEPYQYFVGQLEDFRKSKENFMPECDKILNMHNFSKNDDIQLQHSYNIQNGLIAKGKHVVAEKDYLRASRIEFCKNDVPQARAMFENKIAFKTADCF